MNFIRLRASTAVAIALLSTPVLAQDGGRPEVSPSVAPALPGGETRRDQGFERQTQSLLDQLRVNDPTVAAPSRERPTRLRSGTAEHVALPIGGARTIVLPGAFENAVVVAPEIAQVIVLGTGRAQVIARSPGSTEVVFTAASGEVFKARVSVSANAGPVQDALNAALPGERITVTPVNGALMLTGTTRDSGAAATAMNIARRFVPDPSNVVNNIQVLGGQQVMLRVRVAEVNRTVIKQLGLNSAFNNKPGGAMNGIFGNSPNLAGYGVNVPAGGGALDQANTLGGVQPFQALGAASNPIAFLSTKAFGTVFTTVASALESEGLVRTLAEPNLVTQSGKMATMMAGTQYPVPQVSITGITGTEYRNIGVSLGFTPVVASPNSIQLEIATEVSTKGDNVAFGDGNGGTFNVASFNTRKAQTTVELPSGGSIVIAGLVTSDFQNTLAGIPGVKDIPILGKLFSSSDFQRRETELVISVTAYLVEPIDAARISAPIDGLLPPSDIDMYFLQRLTGNATRRQAPPPSAARTFGFITE